MNTEESNKVDQKSPTNKQISESQSSFRFMGGDEAVDSFAVEETTMESCPTDDVDESSSQSKQEPSKPKQND